MTQFTTLPCATCGYSVAREAKRCPSCDAKRPAPTPANLVRAIGGLAVLVVVLVALVGGCSSSGSSESGAVKTLVSQEGDCLSTAGVSTSGATVVPFMDGSSSVVLNDGAVFTVSGGYAYAKNGQATADLNAGGPSC